MQKEIDVVKPIIEGDTYSLGNTLLKVYALMINTKCLKNDEYIGLQMKKNLLEQQKKLVIQLL